jgi:AcrR family transcriptional regulator
MRRFEVPRQPDPDLEQQILDAASRLWARGGEKSLTMRAVAKAAGTTTPTVYERFRDRDDILRALRMKTRRELFAALSRTRTLAQACQRYLEFALDNREAYFVLFDGVAQPPSLHEPWPSFNFLRQRLAERLGGTPQGHTRLMLAVWALIHGMAMLINRGNAEGSLRTQMFHACVDGVEAVVDCARRSKGKMHSGPDWPANLVLGEADHSRGHDHPKHSGRRTPRRHNARMKTDSKRRRHR